MIIEEFDFFNETLPYMSNKMLNRKDVIKLFNIMGLKSGAEIGVSSGRHSKQLCELIDDIELLLIDPWKGYKETQYKRTDRVGEETFQHAKRRLKPYNVKFMRMTSMEAANKIKAKSLDFVHIDGLHNFDDAMMDIITWSKKIRQGGIMSGHDYLQAPGTGVVSAVHNYTTAHNINNWYITTETVPNWFWVKK